MTEVVQQLVNAISLGATYALLALGLAMVLNVLGLINFAHGELLTVGAYAMYAGHNAGLPFALQLCLCVVCAGLTAILVEQVAFRPLRGSSFVTMLFASFAVSIIIQNILRLAVSPRQLSLPVPEVFDSVLRIGEITVGWLQIICAGLALATMALLTLFLQRTTQGLGMLAVAQDAVAARLVGVPVNRVITAAFAISGMLAGVAALFVVARRGTIDPSMGLQPVIAAVIGTVIGGIGSLRGAVFGGFVLGALEVGFDATLPDGLQQYSAAFTLFMVIAILYFRPRGLFETTEEAR